MRLFREERVVAVSGTREGISGAQSETFMATLHMLLRSESGRCELIHGGCTGVDEMAHRLALRRGLPIDVYPGPRNPYRAELEGEYVLHKEMAFLARNKRLVELCSVLLAAPLDNHPRRGTWATIRYGIESGKPTLWANPDGTLEDQYGPVPDISEWMKAVDL